MKSTAQMNNTWGNGNIKSWLSVYLETHNCITQTSAYHPIHSNVVIQDNGKVDETEHCNTK